MLVEPIKPPTFEPPATLPDPVKLPEKVVGSETLPTLLHVITPTMPPTLLLLASGVVTFVPAKTLPLLVKFVATPAAI